MLLAKVTGSWSVPGDIPVMLKLPVLHVLVPRPEVYAVLFVPPLPSPKSAQIIFALSGLLSRNDPVRNWLLSRPPHSGPPLAKVDGWSAILINPIKSPIIFIIAKDQNIPKRYFLWCFLIW